MRLHTNNYWTKEKCLEEAKKYISRSDFQLLSNSAYQFAFRKGWLDEICSHMEIQGNLYKRLIYAYEFSDNHVYIGLTYNINIRQKNRNTDLNDAVTKYQNETGLIPIRKILTDYLNKDIASKVEGEFLEKYKSEGWIILNKAKTGSLGGNKEIKWTKEACLESAKKYNTRRKWYINEGSAYDAAKIYSNEFFEECCSHMDILHIKWTKESCLESAKKYNTRADWRLLNSSSYQAAKRISNEFFEECCSHMIKPWQSINQRIYI